MARLPRAVFPGLPHHVTQRGNGGQQTFFSDQDYALYRDLLTEHACAANVKVWAWVLMPNHVHLVLVPQDEDAIRRCLSAVHRRYAGHINARLKRTGHFWQGRFGCVAMDETHLGAAIRYIALNPVRAGLAGTAADWRWSSVHVHLGRIAGDGITDPEPVTSRFADFAEMLAEGEDAQMSARIRKAETIGRPIGSESFLRALESKSGRALLPRKRGPRPKDLMHCPRNPKEFDSLSP